MGGYLRLIVDNSGGGIGLPLPKKRRVKGKPVLIAKRKNLPVKSVAVRKAAKRPPVADPARRDIQGAGKGRRPPKRVDDFADCHGDEDNSTNLDKSSGLDVGHKNTLNSAILDLMKTAGKRAILRSPRHLESIGVRLIDLRESLDLSQREFCKRADVGTTTYNNWERGVSRPELDMAMRLCDTYQVTLDWIYRGEVAGLPYHVAEMLRRKTG